MSGALIVTGELARTDFGWLEELRQRHYPPERNRVPVHLTMFHALPPSVESEVRSRLAALSADPPPRASIEGLLDLGGAVAFRVLSPDLDSIREQLASDLHGLLGAEDSGGWRPHITIQNKVAPRMAGELKRSLDRSFSPRPVGISGLGLHRYAGGPWERIAVYSFRG